MCPEFNYKNVRYKMKKSESPWEKDFFGHTQKLSIDHIIPTNRGGSDVGDNAVWACRSCNSSKSDSDLFAWWFSKRDGFPPLFLIRVYLKQAIIYFSDQNRLEEKWVEIDDAPFDLAAIPLDFPSPDCMRFTFHHERIQKQTEQAAHLNSGERGFPT
jgi:hypothetical protein